MPLKKIQKLEGFPYDVDHVNSSCKAIGDVQAQAFDGGYHLHSCSSI